MGPTRVVIDQMPSAVERRCGGKIEISSAWLPGIIGPETAPWSTRNSTSDSRFQAIPHNSEAKVNRLTYKLLTHSRMVQDLLAKRLVQKRPTVYLAALNMILLGRSLEGLTSRAVRQPEYSPVLTPILLLTIAKTLRNSSARLAVLSKNRKPQH